MSNCILLSCPDRAGIVAAVTGALASEGANLIDLQQHSEPPHFAMRVEYEADDTVSCLQAVESLQEEFSLTLSSPSSSPRVAVLCSSEDHCLTDMLWRFDTGELPGQVCCVLSTSDVPRERAEGFSAPFSHLPVASRDQMPQHENELLERLVGQVDLVILARYMRILSGDFLSRLGCPAINIHHSFLPAFVGADPYERAHQRGVKLIGATAHYVTEELDAGPIIEQEVVRVSHRDSAGDLKRLGRDVERVCLARAVKAHLEGRVAVWGSRTFVF